MSQAATFSLLTSDTALQEQGVTAESVYASNAVDTPEERPFLILRWAEVDGESYGGVKRRNLTVWAHDSGQDYARINKILKRVQEILEAATHVPGDDGFVLTQARWITDSSDFVDDGFRTITRSSTYTVGARAA